jgi:hypothetical protein
MEALRIEGLKAIKKWRAWQAFKSADRIDALAAFMYAKPNTGTLVLELPTLVPDEPVLPATKKRALTEAVCRLRECLEELGPGDDKEQEEVASEIIVMCRPGIAGQNMCWAPRRTMPNGERPARTADGPPRPRHPLQLPGARQCRSSTS